MQFVTEKEVEDIKIKKQKEWERVRRPDQPLERPEEPVDNRTLYERLKAQKDQKQEEFEEQFKFKNMIYKGLNDEEAVFLQLVADKQAKLDAEKRDEETQELLAYRDAVDKLKEEADSVKPLSITATPSAVSSAQSTSTSTTATRVSSVPTKTHKSQLSLIAGSIKTKRKRGSIDEKPSPEKKQKLTSPTDPAVSSSSSPSASSALTGLAAYSSSDSDDSQD